MELIDNGSVAWMGMHIRQNVTWLQQHCYDRGNQLPDGVVKEIHFLPKEAGQKKRHPGVSMELRDLEVSIQDIFPAKL